MKSTVFLRLAVAALLAPAALAPGIAIAAEPVTTREFRIEADRLRVANLIGEIRIGRAAGSAFEVTAEVYGSDATLETLKFDVSEGSKGTLSVVYPDGVSRFIYPPMGRGSNATFSRRESDSVNWLSWLLPGVGRDEIRVSGSGKGTEVWADLTIRVPDGKGLDLHHGAGAVAANDVSGDLNLSTRAGKVSVRAVRGDVGVDTGSGSVTAEDIRGSILIDTGSGHVDLTSCSGPSIRVDTGSGSVEANEIDTKDLSIDTGSGGIDAGAIAADRVTMDTGSGGVDLSLDRIGDGPINIDTGAGGIDLAIPQATGVNLYASTASGGIRLAGLGDVKYLTRDRDEVHATAGDGATRINLDTGNGGIDIRGR